MLWERFPWANPSRSTPTATASACYLTAPATTSSALEPCDQCEPILQCSLPVDGIISHLPLVVTNNLYKCTHDKWYKCHPQQHYYKTEYHLVLSLRGEVTVACWGKGDHSEVAGGYKSISVTGNVLLLEILGYEGILLGIRGCIDIQRDQVPETTDKVDDNNSHDYQSKDFIAVHKDVLSYNTILSGTALEERTQEAIETGEIKDFDELWQTEQAE